MASSSGFDAYLGRPEINADLQDVAHQVHEEFANQPADEFGGRPATPPR